MGATNSSPNPVQGRYKFPKSARLKGKDFLIARRSPKVASSEHFTLRWVEKAGLGEESLESGPRLGISFAPRTKSAVVRNRAKGILREIFRLERSNLGKSADLHITVRPLHRVKEVQYFPWREEFISVCTIAGFWK